MYSISPNITIGRAGYDNEHYFDGKIDEVQIFSRALTSDEISDLYNNYGQATSNGEMVVRKRVTPEPSHSSWGCEETRS